MRTPETLSWEEAVRLYRAQPGNQAAVRDNYFDLPVRGAAERYARGEEFAEVLRLLGPGCGNPLLDLGAGNGIASFALAHSGWEVTSLEPDGSAEVGAGAIRRLAEEAGLPIKVVQEAGERLPFPDESFAAVHARQVLHHAADLKTMVREMARVILPGGSVLVTREHVVDDEEQLADFRANHPLHHLYGGENAYPLSQYLAAFGEAGLVLRATWGPFESILNFYPGTEDERRKALRQIAGHSWFRLGRLLAWSEKFRSYQVRRATRYDRTPGRIFSFLLSKP
jgi:SAM-dependent methyltransferase